MNGIVPILYILFIHVRIAKIYNWKVFDHARSLWRR